MSRLRDFLVAPRTGEGGRDRAGRAAAPAARAGAGHRRAGARARPARGGGRRRAGDRALGAGRPRLPLGARLVPAFRAPARAAAARLAASLRARGLEASARGRLALVHLPDEGRTEAVTRALAAAGGLPTVLAVAGRDEEVDALLAARDAILVALPSSAEPAMAQLALAGAAALAPAAAAVTLALDPVQRALALAGAKAPGAVLAAVQALSPEMRGAAAASPCVRRFVTVRGSAVARVAATLARWRVQATGRAGERRDGGLLPLVVLVGALLWQAVVAGQALWLSGAAARAAARAAAVGADAQAAAEATLPPRLESGLRVRQVGDGVGVAVRVPSVLSGGSFATVRSRAAFPRQRR